MKKTRLLTTLILALASAYLSALTITSATFKGQEVAALHDGVTKDNSAWNGTIGGTPQLVFTFDRAEHVKAMRIHPGLRIFAGNPSTESGPSSIRLYGRLGKGEWKALLPDAVSLPRDPQVGEEFFVDVPFPAAQLDAIRVDLLATHDKGFRMDSPNKPVVPPEQFCVSIREVSFVSEETENVSATAQQARLARADAFLKDYDAMQAAGGSLAVAVKKYWGARLEGLRALLTARQDMVLLEREAAYLQAQVAPYLGARLLRNEKENKLTLRIRVEGEAKAGVPVEFPLHFALLSEACGEPLSRVSATVSVPAGVITSTLVPLTPDRARLCWALREGCAEYTVAIPCGAQAAEAAPSLNRIVGSGEQLMIGTIAKIGLPHNLWNVRFRDILGVGQDALLAGRWTDFAHIWRNMGTADKPRYMEAAHYRALDPYDEPIGTSAHHGLAFSLADGVDVDGDGKMDLFMQRAGNMIPRFLHNRSLGKGGVDFAEPVPVKSLTSNFRYAYADLDGDGIADAIGTRLDNPKVLVQYNKGLGLDADGVPRFGPPQVLSLGLPDTTEPTRSLDATRPYATLDDLNKDGLIDLTVSIPPFFYICYNRGTARKFSFAPPVQLRTVSGNPVRNDFYFPNVAWGDFNGDGVPDLFNRTAAFYYPGRRQDKELVVADARVGLGDVLEKQLELTDRYAGLASFSIVDLDNDGKLEFVQVNGNFSVTRLRFEDGLFKALPVIQLAKPGFQRFGCPDNTEYGAPYCQQVAYDFDGDGRLDLLLNDEHNWRMGYFSLFLNKGDNTFSDELRVTPKPDESHLQFADTSVGKALKIMPETSLDYLALKTADYIQAEAGAVAFDFAAADDAVPQPGRTFISSNFWDKKRFAGGSPLYESYRRCKTLEQFLDEQQPGLALCQLTDGRLRLQLGAVAAVSAAPVPLAKGALHRFEVKWDAEGATVTVDGKPCIQTNAKPGPLAEHLHLGSMGWLAVQYYREYPNRRATHPVDFATPACGAFATLKMVDAAGKVTADWRLQDAASCAPFRLRSLLCYRCAPAVMENFNGQPALIAHFDDNGRTEMNGAHARLYAVPFTRQEGKAPSFGEPVPLSHADGTPFYAHSRTVVVPYDWNGDGHTDIILSTENFSNKYNVGVALFLNDGQWRFTQTTDPEIIRLNDLLTAHHDVKLAMVHLTGAALEDMVVWTDPGIRVYSRSFLQQQTAPLKLVDVK